MNYGLSNADATPGQTFVIGGMNKVKEAVKEDKMKTLIKVLMPFIVSFLFSCVAYGQLKATTPEKAILNPGKIGVVSASFRPESAFQKPMTRGKAAAHGAGFGAIAPIAGGFYLGGPGGAIYGILLAPVGAAVGGIVGVVTGRRSEMSVFSRVIRYREILMHDPGSRK